MKDKKYEKIVWFIIASSVCYNSALYLDDFEASYARTSIITMPAFMAIIGYIAFCQEEELKRVSKEPFTILVIGFWGVLIGLPYGFLLMILRAMILLPFK